MAGITLKVSPEELKNKAVEIQNQIKKVESDWKKISDIMKNSKTYWVGDASKLNQQYRASTEEDIDLVLKSMKEQPKKLLEMAKIYQGAEKDVIEAANTLPDDVIK